CKVFLFASLFLGLQTIIRICLSKITLDMNDSSRVPYPRRVIRLCQHHPIRFCTSYIELKINSSLNEISCNACGM
ncbi:MAG: hypothetical protein WAL42_01465, partial [Nitrososphaeraceae archaeon]